MGQEMCLLSEGWGSLRLLWIGIVKGSRLGFGMLCCLVWHHACSSVLLFQEQTEQQGMMIECGFCWVGQSLLCSVYYGDVGVRAARIKAMRQLRTLLYVHVLELELD